MFERDPGAVGRAFAGHARTQDHLAEFLERRGILALSPAQSPVQFDLAWELAGRMWVAEVKSLSKQNETVQIRLALGQVIDYAWRLTERYRRSVRKVVALERSPEDPAWGATAAPPTSCSPGLPSPRLRRPWQTSAREVAACRHSIPLSAQVASPTGLVPERTVPAARLTVRYRRRSPLATAAEFARQWRT